MWLVREVERETFAPKVSALKGGDTEQHLYLYLSHTLNTPELLHHQHDVHLTGALIDR